MKSLAERLLRVAMTGVVPTDDPHVIADAQAEIERLARERDGLAFQLRRGRDHSGWHSVLGSQITMTQREDWTINPKTGRSNSSPLFEALIEEVARIIRSDARQLLAGNAHMTARLIMAQLAHVHKLAPTAHEQKASK